MSGPGVIPDDAELRRTADLRTRRFRAAAVPGIVAVAVLVPVLTWLGVGADRPTPLLLAAMFVPTAVGIGFGLLAYRFLRRRSPAPALVDGGDPETRRAVRRALRTGRAPGARIHELARDAATQSIGPLRRQQWIFGVLVVIWVLILGLRIAEGDDLFDIALAALATVFFGWALAGFIAQRRRSVRYLREGRPAEPGDPAA